MKKTQFAATPYMLTLSILLIISFPASYMFMLIAIHESLECFLQDPGALQLTLLLLSLYIVLLVTLFAIRYQWAAIAEICADNIVFHALFTRRIFHYRDIHYIGIDFGLLNGKKQFWIYFSIDPVPLAYYHNILKAKPSKTYMRVQYSTEVYNFLIENTPIGISQQLRKSYSTVLLYKLDEK